MPVTSVCVCACACKCARVHVHACSLLEWLPLSNRKKRNQRSEDSTYVLGCAQMDLVMKPESFCHALCSLSFVGTGGGGRTYKLIQRYTHTHTPFKGLQLHKQGHRIRGDTWKHEEVRICAGLSYKQTRTIPFRWNASVPTARSGNSASGWIRRASELGLRWGTERFQTSPSVAFQKQWDAFLYVQNPGPSDWFFFFKDGEGLFEDCFYSSIKPAWSSVCKPLNSLNASLSLWVDEPIKDI